MVKQIIATVAMAAAATASDIIPGEFIVQVRDNARMGDLMAMHAEDAIIHKYEMNGFTGYAFRGSENEMLRLTENAAVVSVEPNRVMKAYQTCADVGARSWGLTRLNSRNRPNYDGTFQSTVNVSRVTQYVLDTGIRMTHNAFNNAGNARGVDCTGRTGCIAGGDTDRQGHGTHVAGTMGGNDYGVARSSRLIPVKVLGDNGSGTTAGVIAGVNWTAEDCKSNEACVGNMSLGGGFSSALNNAVNAAVQDGVVMVVAAGNENQNACNVSPGSAERAITVGSTDSSDRRSSFSNWGDCVNILAPGSAITSAWITNDSSTNTISGTSMASPHVAGVAALLLEQNLNASPAQILNSMLSDSTSGAISDLRGSPDAMLYSVC